MNRRAFVATTAALPFAQAAGGEIRREIFLKAPGNGTAIMAYAYYTKAAGAELMSVETRWTRSDTIDIAYLRRSSDNGKTWSAPTPRTTGEKRPNGMLRRHNRPGWADPKTKRLLTFWLEGILPSDDPLEGAKAWDIYYTIDDKPEVHKIPRPPGGESMMLGDITCLPLALPDGAILVPAVMAPLKPDGTIYNPGGGYTYHYGIILRGEWKGSRLEFTHTRPLKIDPARSTRGVDEPTLGSLSRNRVIAVIRGSNDVKPQLPSWRWVSISSDGGRTWTDPAPWTYSNGESFYSPAACSQLLHHSNGRLYWLGNITPENPKGNRPRYPFVIGEVDQDSGLLIKNTVRKVDDKGPNEDPILTLSNFYAREDRQTREIVVHMTRLFAVPNNWQGDAYLYRIPV